MHHGTVSSRAQRTTGMGRDCPRYHGTGDYRRGRITVLDRPGLEARSCECYQVVKTEFDRLLPYVVK